MEQRRAKNRLERRDRGGAEAQAQRSRASVDRSDVADLPRAGRGACGAGRHLENVQAGGYALYRRIFDEQGRQTTALLFQCEASPGRADREAIVASALAHVFAPLDQELHRLTVNLPVANEATTRILQSAGFSTLAEQVFMTRPLA
ncbi:hypothetical protein ABEX03_20755 [Brevibacillus agri]|nr:MULTISPECIES: hypothetical protein [Brevibacillus]